MLKNIVFSAVLLFIPFQLSYADYDTFTVNVPNADGGYTALIIKKSADGYIGPQGEYYPHFPSVAQLQVMYHLGTPVSDIVPSTPIQVQEQAPINTQMIYPQPDEDRAVESDDDPITDPNIVEMPPPSNVVEKRIIQCSFFD